MATVKEFLLKKLRPTPESAPSKQEIAKTVATIFLKAGVTEPKEGVIEETLLFVLEEVLRDEKSLSDELKKLIKDGRGRYLYRKDGDLIGLLKMMWRSPVFEDFFGKDEKLKAKQLTEQLERIQDQL